MKVGLIGTGLMGAPMAMSLLEQGHRVSVFNRTAERTVPLVSNGAVAAEDPAAVIGDSEVVITMLADGEATAEIIAAPGVLEGMEGRTIIQMGTILPGESRTLGSRVVSAGGEWLEAPVLGSIPQVQQRELIVMVGSSVSAFGRWKRFLTCFGPQPRRIGEVGAAAALKLALNQMIAGLTATFASSLWLVQRQGLEADIFMGVLRDSALYAPTFDKKLSRMLEGDFSDPNFPAKHLVKDINLYIETARESGLDARLQEAVKGLVQDAVDSGLGEADYSALYAAVPKDGEGSVGGR